MNRYIITEEQIGRWCGCISTIEAEKIMGEVLSNPYNPQAEREIPDVLICQSLSNEHGFCGKNDCFCKELHRIESGDICKWMQENRKREGKDGET